jgi:hypothetical protein
VALLFMAAAVASIVAMALPLRHSRTARFVAALAAWAAVCGFFGVTFALSTAPIPRDEMLILLGVAPLATAAIACVGAAYLARGIRKARARRAPS